MSEQTSPQPSSRQLWIGGGAAVVVAAALLVFVILPAEYGWDPFGTGKASGVGDLSRMTELERGALREGVLTRSDKPLRRDHWERELGPYESIEFKYEIAEGQPMVFAWRASGPLKYDMHGHPFDGGVDLTESYGQDTADKMEGLYVAPFTGIHGWYWENRSMDNVTLVLDASGMMDSSIVFEGPVEVRREIPLPQ